jgi:hypothetical protein
MGGNLFVDGKTDINYSFELPEFTFRGDGRGPAFIFSDGFKGRGESTNVYAHAMDNTSPESIYVSTSSSKAVAKDFGTEFGMEDGFLYTIRPDPKSVDVNAILGQNSPHKSEFELAIPFEILPRDIRAVTPLNADGSYVGYSFLNPNWRP